ncbi:MAG: cytochrome b/b6 domain-containing protein [Gemmatimonadaceae bacterium]|nr:cytochrome b/b6 domain-containing protein [Gemmatimonadaceae bacterium]
MDQPPTHDPSTGTTVTSAPVRFAMATAAPAPRHALVVRLTHWISAASLVAMAASGLRIFNASPAFARKGDAPWALWPWEGMTVPAWLTLGGWLGGARHWHFAMMWVFVLNALVYVAHLARHGRWRTIVPVRGDWRDAIAMARFYLRRTPAHPHQGKHNALQKQAYTAMLACGAVSVTSGLAIWKPVTLGWLTALYGGYAWARWWHFAAMLALGVLVLAHVAMVFLVDPYALRAMTTGGYDADRWSPEARNARPFANWGPARAPRATAAVAVAPTTPEA